MNPSRLMPLVTVLALLLPAFAGATEPLSDRVEIDGERGRLFDRAQGWVDLPRHPRLSEMAIRQQCSAIGGPRGQYRVADGRLWLLSFYTCGGDVPLGEIFEQASGPMLATWVQGELGAQLGEVICFTAQHQPVFARTAVLQVQAGELRSIHVQPADSAQCAK